jgi:hypothetical protein
MRLVKVKGHYIKKNGKKVYVRPHYRLVVESGDKGRSGKRFKALADKIYMEYLRRGYPPTKAREIAVKTAGKIFWQKYGKKTGRWILKRER